MISIDVLGTPAPKGSVRAFFRPGMKRAVIVKDNKGPQKSWDAAVRESARAIVGDVNAPPFVDAPLLVSIVFRIARPAGHYSKSGKNAGQLMPSAPAYPRTKPDIDKLARATLDALIGTVFDDDSRIAQLLLSKVYAKPGQEGAAIEVEALAS
jgi:Holliday junction resolvase RusA-like endonuclease